MNLPRSPELHPSLGGLPSAETRKARCMHQLGELAALIVRLMEQLRVCERLRPCDPYSPEPYQPDSHFRAIECGNYPKASRLIYAHGIRSK